MFSWGVGILFFVLLLVLILRVYVWEKQLALQDTRIVVSAANATVQFSNIQNGLIVMSDAANSAGTFVWVVGGQAPGVLLGGSGGGATGKQINLGTLTYTPTIKGYTWTKPAGFPLPFVTMRYSILAL